MFKNNYRALPNIISASNKSVITSTLEPPFLEKNESAILDKNMDEIDMSVTSTHDMMIDFTDKNVHMNNNDCQESAVKNSSILPQVTLMLPQSNWLGQNEHHIKTSNVSSPSCLNKVSPTPRFVNDSRVSSSGILHKDDTRKELALIDKDRNGTKIISDAKVSYQHTKPSINQNLCFVTQHNSNVPTQSDPEVSSASLRGNVTVDLTTFETFCHQVWFKDVENSQTLPNSMNSKVKDCLKRLRPLRPKIINIKDKNDTVPTFPTTSKPIPFILQQKMTKPTTERSPENHIKSKIAKTQKQDSRCTTHSPAKKSERKYSFENKSTGEIVTKLPESSAILNETLSKCSMNLAKSKIEEDDGELDSTIDMLQFMLLKEMWNTRSKNADQPEPKNLKLAQNKLFVALLEEFLKKHNSAKYISQLTGLKEFLKKYNIGISIEDPSDAVDKSLIKMNIERVIGVEIVTPPKSSEHSSTALTNAGQKSKDLQDPKPTLSPRNVKKKGDEKIIEDTEDMEDIDVENIDIEEDKSNIPTLELQADREQKPIGGKSKRISNQTTNGQNEKQSSRMTNMHQIKTISNNFDTTQDFIKCKCNETSVYKTTLNRKKYAIPCCFFNNNVSHNNSLIDRDACQLKPKMTRRRTHCFASACDFIKRNGLKQFQNLFLQPMVELEMIRVPSYRNSLNEMLLSNIENPVLSNGTSTTASPGLELANTNSKNNEVVNLMRVIYKIPYDPESQHDRSYIKCMENEQVCKELVSNSENSISNKNETNVARLREITHPNDNNNLLSSPYSSINDDIDTQLHVCRVGDDSPELKLEEIKAETNLASSENGYMVYDDDFHLPNLNFDESVLPERRKIVGMPKRLEITSDTYGPMNSFYIISAPECAPKTLASEENSNDVIGQKQSLEIENKNLWVDDPKIPLNTVSRSEACKKRSETMVQTSVGSPTDIPASNQTIIVNVQNGNSWQNQYNTTLIPLSSCSSNLNFGGNKSTPFIYGLTPHIIRTGNTVDRNGKIPIAPLNRKRKLEQPKNLLPNESLNTTVKKCRNTKQSTPVPWHKKSNRTVLIRSKNDIAIGHLKQLIKINNPQIPNCMPGANSGVKNKDTTESSTKDVQKEGSKRHYDNIQSDNHLIQKTNSREIVGAESTTANNDSTSILRIISSASKDVTGPTLINHDGLSDEDWYDEKEDNESNSKQEYDFQNELYKRYFINLLEANGYHAKFRYSNTKIAVLSANISNLERAEEFVRTFEKFDAADYMIWRDAKQERYLLHRTWLCAKNGEQKPNVTYENLPCQARIHISIKRASDNADNADVLIYKKHSHVR